MNLILDSKTIRTHPAFASPLRVGVLAHLAAFAAPIETKGAENSIAPLCFFVSPAALAATLSASRPQIENAIVDLCKHELIRIDKHQGKRGEWLIDMTKCAGMMVGDDGVEPPKEVPIRDLMSRWDELYEKKNEYKYVRSRSDYWKELGDWNQLYQTREAQFLWRWKDTLMTYALSNGAMRSKYSLSPPPNWPSRTKSELGNSDDKKDEWRRNMEDRVLFLGLALEGTQVYTLCRPTA